MPLLIPFFSFKILDALAEDGLWKAVAVPSRLYSKSSPKKPLAGKHISVKDNFRLKGIKTTQSNRAFVNTYGPETETAVYLQKLIALGAVIVGKTKFSAFASSEEATDQWIDFHAPFNPRADGYQSPSGSTSGGATSLAGYDWLDFSIGTDSMYGLSESRMQTNLYSEWEYSLAGGLERTFWTSGYY